jgi:hypothetical protein
MIDHQLHAALLLAVAVEFHDRHPVYRAAEQAPVLGYSVFLAHLADAGPAPYSRTLARLGSLMRICADDSFINPSVEPRQPRASLARLLRVEAG